MPEYLCEAEDEYFQGPDLDGGLGEDLVADFADDAFGGPYAPGGSLRGADPIEQLGGRGTVFPEGSQQKITRLAVRRCLGDLREL